MLRVTYDHTIFSLHEYGGISRYNYELARRVADADGFSSSVVAPLYINAYLAKGGVPISGFKLPKVPKTVSLIGSVNRHLAPMLIRSSRPDVLHETYYSVHSCAPKGCPIVVTVHDMIHEKFPEWFSHRDSTSSSKRAAVSRANCVLCVSENTRQDLINIFGVPPKKTRTIHLGFALTEPANAVSVDLKLGPFILYVGHRRGYKNFDALMMAYASSASLRNGFNLVAFGGGGFSAQEKGRIVELGLGDGRVRQISGSDALLASLYRKSAIFVYPSLYEGFGIPPLEAMSFDCPVVCSNTSSIPEVVGEAAYLFDPHSIDAMRTAIETVVGSSDIRASLVERGRSRIEQFSWDRCALETMQVYREIVA